MTARKSEHRWTRRPLAAVAALAAVALFASWPTPGVRAEIVDFDPLNDPVPVIVPPADLIKLETLMSGGMVYLMTEPSPDGRYALAAMLQSDAFLMGFVDLESGLLTPLAESPVPGDRATNYVWLDADTVATLNVETEEGEGGAITRHYYRVTMEAATGALAAEEIDLSWLRGAIVDIGPGFRDALVLDFVATPPPARLVDIGPTFDGAVPEIPEDVPGRVGERPLQPIELQQVQMRISLSKLDGTDRRPLVSMPPETGLASVTWSPEGRYVSFGTRSMPNWVDARRERSDPGYVPNLASINVREALGLVPPDENPLVTGTTFYVFEYDGRQAAKLENDSYREGTLSSVIFRPSAHQALVVLAQRSELEGRAFPTYAYPEGLRYMLLDLAASDARPLPVDASAVPGADSLGAAVGFLPDGRLYFAVPAELDTELYALDPATGAARSLWSYSGSMLQVLSTPGGLVFSHSNVDRPWELWRLDSASGVFAPVTSFFETAARASRLRYEEVRWTASDGTAMEGIVVHHEDVRFPGAEPGPLVVWQQGGPGGQVANQYGASVESPYSLLPHFGIPVLMANAAGRSVKTPAFYSALAESANFGQIDIREIKDGVDSMVAAGNVDAARVGVTGCSYGGYFTLQSLRAFPDLYAAANPQCSLVDLTNEFTFGYTPFVSYLMGRAPLADPDEYLRDSPLYGTKDVRTPTLIFHGTDDFLPVPLINNVHDQIEANGVPVRFLRVKGEGHGFGFAASQKLAAQEQLRFFRTHLKVGPFDPAPRSVAFLPIARR